eukprot:TRINITY_DN8473_c0_g1_i1.p1 TRINITY_DN8473_c0_g1~~TRINITY_DN8473_c0_g1_i1.p1  ORF type:complete len:282 (-),score=35.27 TRINITY_DN8473_c0_g1_i1:110-853(-)
MKAWHLLFCLYSLAHAVILDTCDILQTAALKEFFTNEIDPLLNEYGVAFTNDSFLGRAHHFFDYAPIGKKLLTASSVHYCSICTKKFSNKDFLTLHYSMIHLQNQLSADNLLRCPADLCSYLPCYKYFRSNSRAESALVKRTQDCSEDSAYRCAQDFSNAVDAAHPNATRLLMKTIQEFCLHTVCDAEERRAIYDGINSDWKTTLYNVFAIIGCVFAILYYFLICFVYADQKSMTSKHNRKTKCEMV